MNQSSLEDLRASISSAELSHAYGSQLTRVLRDAPRAIGALLKLLGIVLLRTALHEVLHNELRFERLSVGFFSAM